MFVLLYSILVSLVLFPSIMFYCILFCPSAVHFSVSVELYSSLLHSVPFHSILLHSVLLYRILFGSILFYSSIFSFPLSRFLSAASPTNTRADIVLRSQAKSFTKTIVTLGAPAVSRCHGPEAVSKLLQIFTCSRCGNV